MLQIRIREKRRKGYERANHESKRRRDRSEDIAYGLGTRLLKRDRND